MTQPSRAKAVFSREMKIITFLGSSNSSGNLFLFSFYFFPIFFVLYLFFYWIFDLKKRKCCCFWWCTLCAASRPIVVVFSCGFILFPADNMPGWHSAVLSVHPNINHRLLTIRKWTMRRQPWPNLFQEVSRRALVDTHDPSSSKVGVDIISLGFMSSNYTHTL